MRSLSVPMLCLVACSGASSNDRAFNVTWSFEAGDCASNGVTQVRFTFSKSGADPTTLEFPCSAGAAQLGTFDAGEGSYSISAVGLDASGTERFRHQSTTMVSNGGTRGTPIDLVLRPKPGEVVATWRGCPGSVVLPYHVTVYRPPATDGGALTQRAGETQESCTTRTATVVGVVPGSYVVELNSRTVTPRVLSTRPVTVSNGERVTVDFPVP